MVQEEAIHDFEATVILNDGAKSIGENTNIEQFHDSPEIESGAIVGRCEECVTYNLLVGEFRSVDTTDDESLYVLDCYAECRGTVNGERCGKPMRAEVEFYEEVNNVLIAAQLIPKENYEYRELKGLTEYSNILLSDE